MPTSRKPCVTATAIALVIIGCAKDRDDVGGARGSAAPAPTPSASTVAVTGNPPVAAASAVADGGVLSVSIIEVLARPHFYDGRQVTIAGFLGSNDDKLYLTREHAEHKLTRYAVALNRADCHDHFRPYPVALDDLRAGYVKVEGTLSIRMGGEAGESPIGLCSIQSIEALRAAEQ